MYIRNFELDGREYPMAYTLAVDLAVETKYNKNLKAVLNEGMTEHVLFIFRQMLFAGQKWAKKNNVPCLEVPEAEEIAEMVDAETQRKLVTTMGELFAGHDRQVIAKPSKKAEAGALGE